MQIQYLGTSQVLLCYCSLLLITKPILVSIWGRFRSSRPLALCQAALPLVPPAFSVTATDWLLLSNHSTALHSTLWMNVWALICWPASPSAHPMVWCPGYEYFFFSLVLPEDTGSRAPAGTSYTIWKSFVDQTEIPRHWRAGRGPRMDALLDHVLLLKKGRISPICFVCLWRYFHYRAGLFKGERPTLHLLSIFDLRPSQQRGDEKKKKRNICKSAVWIWLRLTSSATQQRFNLEAACGPESAATFQILFLFSF